MDRKRAAARMDSSAVTGPCTAEYGPCKVGKRKMANTDRTATKANPQAIRPGVIGSFNYTCNIHQGSVGRWLLQVSGIQISGAGQLQSFEWGAGPTP